MLRPVLALAALLPSAASYAEQGPAAATITACFTPGPESCAELIADRIDAAQSKVRVQAYWLTSPPDLARHRRSQAPRTDVARFSTRPRIALRA